MSKSIATETNFLNAVFLGTDPPWRDAGVVPSLYIALHTADPGEGGDQTTNEVPGANYTGYARVAVARNVGGWTVVGDTTKNTAAILFPVASGIGDNVTVRFVSIGTVALPGAGQILYSGQLTEDRTITNGIQPQFVALSLQITEE